ncbi:MAG: hypothetical protein KIT31_33685 [Deltaproteobacteria bacterium]|nr:hypothetical protein [Deltaproteobacteria bacterium]
MSQKMQVTIPIQISVTVGAPVPGPARAPIAQLVAPPVARRPVLRPDKAKTVAAFLETGAWRVVMSEASSEESVATIDEAWLTDIKQMRRSLGAEGVELEGGPGGTTPAPTLARFRDFYKKPDLTAGDVDGLLQAMEIAVGDPAAFFDVMQDAQHREPGPSNPGDESVFDFLKIPFRYPTRAPSFAEKMNVARLRGQYGLPADVEINPREHHFEVADPGWWPLWRAKAAEQLSMWPAGLEPFRDHEGRRTVFEGVPGTTKVALLADFGVGHYHSELIARVLEGKKYPYVFHLGDVYYGGTQDEFDRNYTAQMRRVMAGSTLFSMPENHELYARGTAYLKFLADGRAAGKVLQETTYFCVRFPKHQIVAIDVNWNGRQRFKMNNKAQRTWLRARLDEGKAAGLTTILLSGSAPYCYGDKEAKLLYDEVVLPDPLDGTGFGGDFHMWFWGDDHYCALFPYDEKKAPFVGSCIGHGGYPGDRQKPGKDGYLRPVWVETEPRFPAGSNLRDDLGNNGWVELTMRDDGGVELLYVDWLARRRAFARYEVANAGGDRRVLRLVQDPAKLDLGRDKPL